MFIFNCLCYILSRNRLKEDSFENLLDNVDKDKIKKELNEGSKVKNIKKLRLMYGLSIVQANILYDKVFAEK